MAFPSTVLLLTLRHMKILVTGSSGLIGSEAAVRFDREGHKVVGVDNNLRREFFGLPGDTLWNLERIKKNHSLLPPSGHGHPRPAKNLRPVQTRAIRHDHSLRRATFT
jgi:NAD(P)-dependent dehydrogenase (short-subunit alcohol dehydrogenase family)